MHTLRKKVEQFIVKEGLLGPGTAVIVGLSGGADSVVLTHILHGFGYKCVAVHCNFHLRGEEANRDEVFANEFASVLGIPFLKVDFDTYRYASDWGISIEMAARELRYDYFEKIRKEKDAAAVAVAHHRDDNIETLLLNLIRGTGIRGLTGMNPKNGFVIRPLLCLTKEEILSYVREEGLNYVTDSGNLKPEFVRNKIRLQVIPLLETLNPSVKDALERTILNLSRTRCVYERSVEEARKVVFDEGSGRIFIPMLRTFASPGALLYEILSGYGFGRAIIEEIREAMDALPGKVFYSQTHRLVKDRNTFILNSIQPEPSGQLYRIEKEDRQMDRPIRLTIKYEENIPGYVIKKDKQIAYLDAEKLIFPLILRKWKTGDRFFPFGMKGSKKLSDYFRDQKYSKPDKEGAWILCSGDLIVWVVGERIDRRFSIRKDTKTVCIMNFFE